MLNADFLPQKERDNLKRLQIKCFVTPYFILNMGGEKDLRKPIEN